MTPIEIFVLVFVLDHVALAGGAVYVYFKKYKPFKSKIDSLLNTLEEVSKDYKSTKKQVNKLWKRFEPIIGLCLKEDEKDE